MVPFSSVTEPVVYLYLYLVNDAETNVRVRRKTIGTEIPTQKIMLVTELIDAEHGLHHLMESLDCLVPEVEVVDIHSG